MPSFIQVRPEGLILFLKIQPRAAKNAIGGIQGKELKVRITAPPVDSAANEALVRFLAETLGCARNAVHIVRGQTSRHKQVLITSLSLETVAQKLT